MFGDGDDDDNFGLSIEDNDGASSSAQLRDVAEAKVDNTLRVDGAAGRKQALSKMVADLGFNDDNDDSDAASKASNGAKGGDDGGVTLGARGGAGIDHNGSSRSYRPLSGAAQAKDDFGDMGGGDEDDDLLDLMDQASCK